MRAALEALARLKAGNLRFIAGAAGADSATDHDRRSELLGGQEPFAVILGCADSRVPAEIVFDQGLGDLFVVRVAGNIVQPSQLGSIEFAAAKFQTRLIVVLGHTQCGAVQACLEGLRGGVMPDSPNLKALVDEIRPALEPLVAAGEHMGADTLELEAVRANVRHSAAIVRTESALLDELVHDGKVLIVGAVYSLESGEVDFFDGLPDELSASRDQRTDR